MKWFLHVSFALGLIVLISLEFFPQLGNAFHRKSTPFPLKAEYSEKSSQLFLQRCFGTPHGGNGSVVRKWKDDIHVKFYGNPDSSDQTLLQSTVETLAPKIASTKLSMTEDAQLANLEVHIIPQSKFYSTLPQYGKQNTRRSYSWCRWDSDSDIFKVTILIDQNLNTPLRENQLLRLLARNLGLINFTLKNEDSAFSDSSRNIYSPLDISIIQLLYEKIIISGMTKKEASAQLNLAGAHLAPMSSNRENDTKK